MVAFSRIAAPEAGHEHLQSPYRRFDSVAITSVFGDPLDRRTWSGAPLNLALALSRLGIDVVGIHPHISKAAKIACAVRHAFSGYGPVRNTAQILRGHPSRRLHAAQVESAIGNSEIRHVLHTGTFDLPALRNSDGVKHYLYCDQTWSQARSYRSKVDGNRRGAVREYERLEFESLARLDHIFTFGAYVRDEIVGHYGIPADRVTAVGSGMGAIEPHFGPKTYTAGRILFVAKHLFREKGGALLVDAFMSLHHRYPNWRLTIVGDERSRRFVPDCRAIDFRPHVSWDELQQLYREASLLAQPMLNDPWGQVYLEALVSRTPVLGLARNGLPEITCYGRYGFLVDEAEPQAVARGLVEAMGDVDRLAWMGGEGQRHALRHYSWDAVAARIAAG